MAVFLSLVVLILSIIAHEVAHGYAANALGDPTARLAGRLTLNPIPHIDLMGSIIIPGLLVLSGSPILFGWAKPVPYNPYNLHNQRWSEALVKGAGCATNIALALFFGLLVRFAGGALPAPAIQLASTVAFVNLFLGLFNLIPFPTLDGYGVLYGLLPWRPSRTLQQFERQMRSFDLVAMIVFLSVFSYVLANPFYRLVLWIFSKLTGAS